MNKKVICLGDEIKDVTTGLRGICIGELTYLSGLEYWVLQPHALAEDTDRPRELYVEKCYYVKNGAGVYPDPAPKQMGFVANAN